MARVTVEDCIDKVPGRFDLVLLAAHRSRAMTAGSEILVDRDNDKNPVVALREIADEKVAPEELEEDLITSLQRYSEIEEVGDEEELALLESPEDIGDSMEEMSEEDLLAALQQEAEESGK